MVARVVWEHRRSSHRTKAKIAESPSTVRFLDGMENKKWRSKMCLTTDLTTYTQKPKNSIQNRGVAQLGARDIWEHRRCSHRTKAKIAESPSTVRISGGLENKK